MENIWGFLLQTLSVSIVAALLLIAKGILHDKLSPRWQYGVWVLLALRIFIPASLTRGILHQPFIWLETAKMYVEHPLHSVYSFVYTPIYVNWPIPFVFNSPQSVTDWIFILYTAGTALTLLWYFISYVRLRLSLSQGNPAKVETQNLVNAVCREYGLPGCQVTAIPGLPSAFVCGIIRPVLVIPAEKCPDKKVILHELLHLKYKDSIQSVVWCIMRSLHWCNPFLQYVFNRIGNDMESLCDQRVLERLEGEERREYGAILLDMANDRFPRTLGTTSISNGGKNISRRISAITRFKRYPRGMALVSVCIFLVLAIPSTIGLPAEYSRGYYQPSDSLKFQQAMSLSRINRCTTVAGALDTYAKGLILDNGIYIATASPLKQQETLITQMSHNAEVEGWVPYHLDSGSELTYLDRNFGYQILNLKKQSDHRYEAYLLFSVTAFLNSDGLGWLCDENGEVYTTGCVLIPVTIFYEDAWVLEESGGRGVFPGHFADDVAYSNDTPSLTYHRADGKSGTVSVWARTRHTVENHVEDNTWEMFGGMFGMAFDENIKPNAVFNHSYIHRHAEYYCPESVRPQETLRSVSMEIITLNETDETPVFNGQAGTGDTSWGSNDGAGGASRHVDSDWDGFLTSGSGGSMLIKDNQTIMPAGYAVRILWDGVPVEDFILTEVIQ